MALGLGSPLPNVSAQNIQHFVNLGEARLGHRGLTILYPAASYRLVYTYACMYIYTIGKSDPRDRDAESGVFS